MKIELLKRNIGVKDRNIRLLGGLTLSALGCLTKNSFIKSAGCVFLLTGITQKCIFYDLLNIDTYNKNDK